jgi:hypothetical protein
VILATLCVGDRNKRDKLYNILKLNNNSISKRGCCMETCEIIELFWGGEGHFFCEKFFPKVIFNFTQMKKENK